MTGCPAWYDLSTIDNDYAFHSSVRTLVLSAPAGHRPEFMPLLRWLTRRFPKARRVLSFHHGMLPSTNSRGLVAAGRNLAIAIAARQQGWKIASLAGSLQRLEHLYGGADLHIGYRVHAHLYCLSRRTASILINEDSRGIGQAKAIGGGHLLLGEDGLEPIQAAIDRHFDTRGEGVAGSVLAMRQTFPSMQRFLATL
jgi:hypothetical protein